MGFNGAFVRLVTYIPRQDNDLESFWMSLQLLDDGLAHPTGPAGHGHDHALLVWLWHLGDRWTMMLCSRGDGQFLGLYCMGLGKGCGHVVSQNTPGVQGK